MEIVLELVVVDAGVACGEDQHAAVSGLEGEGLRNARALNAQGLGSKLHRSGGDSKMVTAAQQLRYITRDKVNPVWDHAGETEAFSVFVKGIGIYHFSYLINTSGHVKICYFLNRFA